MPAAKGLPMLRALALTIALAVAGGAAQAQCGGPSLIERLTAEERAALDARVAEMPFAEGLLWQAERDGQVVTLAGTMHVHDPRLETVMLRLEPLLEEAELLLLEVTPAEEAQLQGAVAADPSLMFLTEGPTLPEMLDETTWQVVAEAARSRGIPPFMAAKFRPWFLMMTLSMPACAAEYMAAGEKGLDFMLWDAAGARGLPMQALEPWDTLFSLFGDATMEEQIDFLRAGVLDPVLQQEMFVAMIEGYFAGQVGQVWELGRVSMGFIEGIAPEVAEALFEETEVQLLDARNRAWIPVIEAAAAEHGRVMVAAGAAHLPGEAGVLALLQERGWTITRLP
jgi:uncharacterized protein YbaP (TraB family)